MRLKSTSRLISGAVLCFSVVSIGTILYSYHLTEKRRLFTNSMIGAVAAANALLNGSDTLTSAIRAYAATGDRRYHDEFQKELNVTRSREAAMEVLQRSGLIPAELKLLEQAKQNSDALVSLEDRAAEAAARGDLRRAVSLVFGEEYRTAKASIVGPIRAARSDIETRMLSQRQLLTAQARFAEYAAIGASLASLAAIVAALLVFFRNRVILPLALLTDRTRRLTEGDRTVSFGHRDDDTELGDLARALEAYRGVAEETERQRWIRSCLVEVTTPLQHAETLEGFAHDLLSLLAARLGFGAAAMYLRDDGTDILAAAGGYGLGGPYTELPLFRVGQGLVGETALSGRVLEIEHAPADYLRVVSALGSHLPESLLLLPFSSGTRVIAVLELAFLSPPGKEQRELLAAIAEVIPARLEVLLRSIATGRLLTETREQAQQLEEQAAELEMQTVELEERSQELEEVNREQRGIFDAATSGIVLIRDRMIIRCNRRLEEIFGYPPGGFDGMSTRCWYEDDTMFDEVGRKVAAQLAGQGEFSAEQQLIRRDGSRFWGLMSAQVIAAADAGLTLVGIIEDITGRKRIEQDLIAARDEAESATRAKSEFLANMSHEIRTPMNAIIGMSHLAMKGDLPPRQRDYIAKIRSAGQHLLGIINDILDFSKIEAGKLSIEQTDFNLEKVLGNVADLLNEKAGEKGLELIFDLPLDMPQHLVGDPLRIGQVLLNFGTNAVKFTEQGEICITVRTIEHSDDSILLHFAVRDTGIGLTDEQKRLIFHSFQQGDMSTTRKYGGTGLGLVICKRLAAMMGGETGVESEAGSGSTFWFTARLGLSRQRQRHLLPSPDIRGCRVLVVDDNDNARSILHTILDRMTFRVTDAPSGAAALAALEQAEAIGLPFELVFLDWKMPEMDGLETVRRVRRLGLNRVPPIIMVTAYGYDDIRDEAAAAGIETIIMKPVTPSTLFDSAITALGSCYLRSIPAAAVQPRAPAALYSGRRVLLVEDNPINQEVATGLLQEGGLEVSCAMNGAEALAMLQAQPYDLVLMDMQMPFMDGLTATRRLREMPALAALPVVAMTANAMQQDRDDCFAAGMNDFIVKPIDPDLMWDVLGRWLPSDAAAAAPEREEPDQDGDPLPSGLTGINIQLGLRRVLGRRKRYLELLRKFCAGHRFADREIRQALEAGDRETARRLAHTLSGVAGNIGAGELGRAAGRFESALRDGSESEPGLEEIGRQLQEVIAGLESQLPEESRQCGVIPAEPAEAADACDRLAALLAEDNALAGDLLEEEHTLLQAALGPAFPAIEAAVKAYDFEHALELLRCRSTETPHPAA